MTVTTKNFDFLAAKVKKSEALATVEIPIVLRVPGAVPTRKPRCCNSAVVGAMRSGRD